MRMRAATPSSKSGSRISRANRTGNKRLPPCVFGIREPPIRMTKLHPRKMLRRLAGLAAILFAWAAPALAVNEPLPWGQSSDMAAGQVFTQAVAPSGNPANHTVEFETWASDQDIYTAQPHFPVPGAPKQLQPSRAATAVGPHALTITPNECFTPADAQAGNFPPTGCIGEEVRRNFATYQYIVSNGLNSKAGLP